jgi:hypothetical protein
MSSTTTTTPAAKPKRRARAAPKPKRQAKPKPKKVAAPLKAVRFQSRGPFKCVKVEGASCQGVHPALRRALHDFDYDAALKAHTLVTFDNPPAQTFVAALPTRNKRRLAYSSRQGSFFDTQLGSVVKIRLRHQVPLRVFFDAPTRDHFLALKFGRAATRESTSIRRLCARLLPETEHALRFLYQNNYNPVATQVPVADKEIKVGTRVDLVCTRPSAATTHVFELKLGCERNYTHGRRLGAPFQNRVFTTHGEHQLQTVLTHWLYKRTFPTANMGAPVLLRCDRLGAHGYAPARWAVEGLPALLPRLKH